MPLKGPRGTVSIGLNGANLIASKKSLWPEYLDETINQLQYDFVFLPLSSYFSDVPPRLQNSENGTKGIHPSPPSLSNGESRMLPFTDSDSSVERGILESKIVGVTSSWISISDRDSESLRFEMIQTLNEELQWSVYCGLSAVVLPAPSLSKLGINLLLQNTIPTLKDESEEQKDILNVEQSSRSSAHEIECKDDLYSVSNYAQWLSSEWLGMRPTRTWIPIPFFYTPSNVVWNNQQPENDDGSSNCSNNVSSSGGRVVDGWGVWNALRRMTDSSSCMEVLLCFPPDVDSSFMKSILFERWKSEPIGAVCIPPDWLMPVQGKRNAIQHVRDFLIDMMKKQVPIVVNGRYLSETKRNNLRTILLESVSSVPNANGAANTLTIRVAETARAYLASLWKSVPPKTEYESFVSSYFDHLQVPLQPLADNLESRVYETFELDVVKYKLYGKAFKRAIVDRMSAGQDRHVIAYVGAGRGGIMDELFKVISDLQIENQVALYAVEKNPAACFILRHRIATDANILWRKVILYSGDMRTWQPAFQLDIVVSELLGSFGDNELSPECLDSVQLWMSKNGISIPSSYTSFLEPVSCWRAWYEAQRGDRPEKVCLQMGYVVELYRKFSLSVNHHNLNLPRDKKCFSFKHPNPDINVTEMKSTEFSNRHNQRFNHLEWTAELDAECHGFAGYFEAVLYKDVISSTRPSNHTPEMASWFPFYLPLIAPLPVTGGEKIKLDIWRLSSARKVWFAWAATGSYRTPVHNASGDHYSMSL